jgi:hypothetical protein
VIEEITVPRLTGLLDANSRTVTGAVNFLECASSALIAAPSTQDTEWSNWRTRAGLCA